MQQAKKQSFKLDLAGLHALCEINYHRLLQLFPNYETCNSRELKTAEAIVRIDVVERCRYTTIFRIRQHQSQAQWLGQLRIELRAYHDAGMLEVGMFQSHGDIAGRYIYPNKKMYQQDEKYQQNRFLADWLQHCLDVGRSSQAVAVPDLPT